MNRDRLAKIRETPEERDARRKQRRKEIYKAFYERHKEEQQARMREAYNPEQKKAYYDSNRDNICERMRKIYHEKKVATNRERLDSIIELSKEDPAYATVFKALDPASLSNRDISLLEDIVFAKVMNAQKETTQPIEETPCPILE